MIEKRRKSKFIESKLGTGCSVETNIDNEGSRLYSSQPRDERVSVGGSLCKVRQKKYKT